MKLATVDIAIFVAYVIGLIGLAYWVSREKAGHEKNANDYFLASNSLPWWAIGTSLIAANISAEQIIGMSGSGYVIGLAIASYEWMAALTLIIVGKYFLPIFLAKKIYTMPQFLEQRYDHKVRTILAVFWLGVYVFVNLTAVLWLGALAINAIAGVDMLYGMVFLGAFCGGLFTLWWPKSRGLYRYYSGGAVGIWWLIFILYGAGSTWGRRGHCCGLCEPDSPGTREVRYDS